MNVATTKLEPDTGTPLQLRKLSSEAATLQNALAQVFQPINITAQGAQILTGLDAPRQPQADVPWVHFMLDGAAGAVQVPWGVVRRLTGLAAEGAVPEDGALVLEDALSEALDEAEAACGVTLRLIAIRDTADGLPVASTLNLQGKDAGGSFVQMRQPMVLAPKAAATLAQALASRSVQRDDLPGLAMSCAWETDAITLGAADLDDLEVGDAIELSAETTQGRVVVQGQQAADATRDGSSVTLITGFSPLYLDEETEVSDTNTAEMPPETDVNDIEVRLSFRAGQTSLPLKTLRGMGPGAVIEMTDPASAEVEIVANGRVVGAGELIDVAGRRAVQIRRLFTGA